MPKSALVFGDDLRSFLSVTRSLGRRGVAIDVAPYDFASPALCSRYIRRIHRLPPYVVEPEAWLEALQRVLAEEDYSLVIPCDDRSIIPLMRHRDSLPGVPLALPNERAYEVFFDKGLTREVAASVGVPVARGRNLQDGDGENLADELGLPMAIKPRRSYVADDLASRRNVAIVHDRRHLVEFTSDLRHKDEYVAEVLFPGFGVGVSVLAKDGEVNQAFQHNRVNEPRSGGGSSYRISAAIDPRMLKCVEDLSRATGLTGVAMFEFRYNEDTRDFILLEVNARFWGSLPLAIFAGVDFPWLLYEQQVLGKAEPRSDYRVGVYGRNLTTDFYNLLSNVAWHRREEGTLPALAYTARTVGTWFRGLTGQEKQDSFDWQDMAPAWAEYRTLGAYIWLGVSKRLGIHGMVRRRRLRQLMESLGVRRAGLHHILVLCHGNICRSPFAAKLLDRKLGKHSGVRICSRGVVQREARQSPDAAVRVAPEFGIDLEPHRSRLLRDEDLARANLILLFDEINELELKAFAGKVQVPVLRLGDLVDGNANTGQIEDPYGRSDDEFRRIYREIEESVDALAAVIR